MTHPLTPREKVLLKPCPFCGGEAVAGSNFDNDHYVMCGADCDRCGGMVGYMKTEMAAIENWNRRTALASGSGDHAELARLADDLRKFEHHAVGSLKIGMDEVRRIIAACDVHAALLAENAALRASVVKANDGFEEYERRFYLEQERATEAERKLADERLNYEGAMSDIDSLLNVLIRRINGEADLASAAEWVRLNYPIAAEAIISKEAERG